LVKTEIQGLIEEAIELVVNAQNIVLFTGTGVNTESSTPDATSPRVPPTTHSSQSDFPAFIGNPSTRRRSWQTWNMFRMIEQAQPNPVHHAIAELHKNG